ncbi:MAG: hypothetical protein ABIM42_05300 [candidate division WOR-3 bacterium]
MYDVRYLKTVIQHWIRHNESHLEEYRKWKEIAFSLGYPEVSERLNSSLKLISEINALLEEALNKLPSDI